MKADNDSSRMTSNIPQNKPLKIPIAHGEGRFYTDEKTLHEIINNNQVLFRYCDENGNITPSSNPNGSLHNIAGICNAGRNVYGMMPHPERASEEILGNTDGRIIFESFLANVTTAIPV